MRGLLVKLRTSLRRRPFDSNSQCPRLGCWLLAAGIGTGSASRIECKIMIGHVEMRCDRQAARRGGEMLDDGVTGVELVIAIAVDQHHPALVPVAAVACWHQVDAAAASQGFGARQAHSRKEFIDRAGQTQCVDQTAECRCTQRHGDAGNGQHRQCLDGTESGHPFASSMACARPACQGYRIWRGALHFTSKPDQVRWLHAALYCRATAGHTRRPDGPG